MFRSSLTSFGFNVPSINVLLTMTPVLTCITFEISRSYATISAVRGTTVPHGNKSFHQGPRIRKQIRNDDAHSFGTPHRPNGSSSKTGCGSERDVNVKKARGSSDDWPELWTSKKIVQVLSCGTRRASLQQWIALDPHCDSIPRVSQTPPFLDHVFC